MPLQAKTACTPCWAGAAGNLASRLGCLAITLQGHTFTAFRCKEIHHALHPGVIGAVEHFAPVPLLHHKPGVNQSGEMVRQGGGREAQMRTDVADSQPLIPRFYKQPEDCQAGIMAKGGKGAGVGTGCSHTAKITRTPAASTKAVSAACLAVYSAVEPAACEAIQSNTRLGPRKRLE